MGGALVATSLYFNMRCKMKKRKLSLEMIKTVMLFFLYIATLSSSCYAQRNTQDKIYFMDGKYEEGNFHRMSNDTIFFAVSRFEKIYKMRDVDSVIGANKQILFSKKDYLKGIFKNFSNFKKIVITSSLSYRVRVTKDYYREIGSRIRENVRFALWQSKGGFNTGAGAAAYLGLSALSGVFDAIALNAAMQSFQNEIIDSLSSAELMEFRREEVKPLRHKVFQVFEKYSNFDLIPQDSVDLVADTLTNKFLFPAYKIKLGAKALIFINIFVDLISDLSGSLAQLMLQANIEFRNLSPYIRYATATIVVGDSIMEGQIQHPVNYYYQLDNMRNALLKCETSFISEFENFLNDFR